ncbi:MAG: CPBP family intramembrane metalloprotease [Betaproteobacteria bacterium]|nr:CPBP family intramembrane metalloprotease [Betaproteobacteria bacterium]
MAMQLTRKKHFVLLLLWTLSAGLAALLSLVLTFKGDISVLNNSSLKFLAAAAFATWVFGRVFDQHSPEFAPSLKVDRAIAAASISGIALAFAAVLIIGITLHFVAGHVVVLSPDSTYGLAALDCFSKAAFEELLFRGALLYFVRRLMPDGAAIVVVASVFAVGHWGGQRDIWTLFSFLFAGFSYSLMTLRWQNLWPGIFMHATFNALVLLVSTASAYTPSPQAQLPATGIASLISSMFLFAIVFAITRSKPLEKN